MILILEVTDVCICICLYAFEFARPHIYSCLGFWIRYAWFGIEWINWCTAFDFVLPGFLSARVIWLFIGSDLTGHYWLQTKQSTLTTLLCVMYICTSMLMLWCVVVRSSDPLVFSWMRTTTSTHLQKKKSEWEARFHWPYWICLWHQNLPWFMTTNVLPLTYRNTVQTTKCLNVT